MPNKLRIHYLRHVHLRRKIKARNGKNMGYIMEPRIKKYEEVVEKQEIDFVKLRENAREGLLLVCC